MGAEVGDDRYRRRRKGRIIEPGTPDTEVREVVRELFVVAIALSAVVAVPGTGSRGTAAEEAGCAQEAAADGCPSTYTARAESALSPRPNMPPGTDFSSYPLYDNIMRAIGTKMALYLPLDKGNSWTYSVATPDGTRRETYSIVAVTQQGWSRFDLFFGKRDVSLMFNRLGTLLVLYDARQMEFYPKDVEKRFVKKKFSTPAGTFTDLLLITAPPGNKIAFKDVYAKGVGLVYHEHGSEGKTVRYTLVSAQVRDKRLPEGKQ